MGDDGMPHAKKAQRLSEQRAAQSLCLRCDRPRDPNSIRYCALHLKYDRDYQRLQREEDTSRRKNRCTICRKFGHNRRLCQDPRAAEILAAEKKLVN